MFEHIDSHRGWSRAENAGHIALTSCNRTRSLSLNKVGPNYGSRSAPKTLDRTVSQRTYNLPRASEANFELQECDLKKGNLAQGMVRFENAQEPKIYSAEHTYTSSIESGSTEEADADEDDDDDYEDDHYYAIGKLPSKKKD
ncbi:unnamed protein product [Protopolystoma xenopodis]|uniref:Uncharacterized protein n=1 Tax=Protopolystoma xenopodis TaxID=117903 RepID=A0A448WXW9_9PLAT|nr:unnamed protein product [Protopolystoma xenopodis]